MPGSAAYDERLVVPLRWWALATMFLASLLIAFLVSTPTWVALGATGVLVLLVVAVFVGYGSARLRVGDGMLLAGPARIPVLEVGAVRPLDRDATRLVAGRDADARAFLLLRPYLPRSVRVEITDPADPTPYWLLATRHPERLTEALVVAQKAAQKTAREAAGQSAQGTTPADDTADGPAGRGHASPPAGVGRTTGRRREALARRRRRWLRARSSTP